MPPLIAFAGALGGLAVVRWAYRTALRVNRELEEARLARVAEAARSGDISDPAARPHHRCLPARLIDLSKFAAGDACAGLGVGHHP